MLTEIVQWQSMCMMKMMTRASKWKLWRAKIRFLCYIFLFTFTFIILYVAQACVTSQFNFFALFRVIFVVNKPSKMVFPPFSETSRELFCVEAKKKIRTKTSDKVLQASPQEKKINRQKENQFCNLWSEEESLKE